MSNFSIKNPQEGALSLLQGDQNLAQGEYSDALKYYDRAIQILPDDADILENAYWGRGVAYASLNRFSDAINDLNCAIKLNESYLLAYVSRADCFLKSENFHKAIEDYEKALILEYDEVHNDASQYLEDQNIIHQKQVKFEIHYGAAMAYNQLVDFKNCLRHLEAAYKIKPVQQIRDYIVQINERIGYLNL